MEPLRLVMQRSSPECCVTGQKRLHLHGRLLDMFALRLISALLLRVRLSRCYIEWYNFDTLSCATSK